MRRKIVRLLSSVARHSLPRPARRTRVSRNPELSLDLAQLEDRILLSGTPLSPDMLPEGGAESVDGWDSVEDVAPDLLDDCCLAVESTLLSDADSELLGDLSDTLNGGDDPALLSTDPLLNDLPELVEVHDHPHFDLDGNEYDVLTALPTLDLDEATLATGEQLPASGLLPLGDTFFLNSNPGAGHTIYLDFDGHVTSGTAWNTSFNGGQDIVTPAFDLDGNRSSFSDAELTRIQYIWQRVAEDFIPFDVNVTTQDPGLDALIKSGSSDTDWGVRVAIGGSSSDWYGNTAGGVAYYNSFNWSSDTPVFVFTAQLGGGSEKYTAEAISHETGHSLNLGHDGRTSPSETYYAGHGSGDTGWAPIMGNSYYKNLTQWSRGEYPYASNTQDDLAIITTNNGFGYRVDDYGNSNSQADLLDMSGSDVFDFGIIERNTDVDVFSFNTAGGDISLQIDPASTGPNLDILASLYNGVGTLITSSNPIGYLNATINATLAAGQYYLHIEGVGEGTPTTGGYSDYGSLGQYFIRGTITPGQEIQESYVSVSVSSAYSAEGDASSTLHTFTVARTGNTGSAASVEYSVSGTSIDAADAADFVGGVLPSGVINFAAGETSKTITIQIAGDDLVEADEAYRVTLDNPTGSMLLATRTAIGLILNDDVPEPAAEPGITVTPTSGLATNENGGTASFTVVLDSRPEADVIFHVTSLDTTEGTVNVSSLLFTAENWGQSQRVTVIGADDSVRDGNVEFTVQVTASSADAGYNAIDPDDVTVTNQDNERGKPIKNATDSDGEEPTKKTPPGLSKGEAVVDGSMEVASPESFNVAVDQLLKSLNLEDASGRVAALQWVFDSDHGPAQRSGEGGHGGAGGNPWLDSDGFRHEFANDPLAKALQSIYGRDTNDDESL